MTTISPTFSIFSIQTLVCDVDNVILNFSKPFQIWMKQTYNIDIEDNPTKYSYFDPPNHNLVTLPYILEFVNTNPTLPLLYSELPALFKTLRRRYRIRIVLLTAFSGSQSIRIQNLKKVGIEFDEIIFEFDKVPVIEKLKPFLTIEDKPKTIRALNDLGHNVAMPSIWRYCHFELDPCVTQYKTVVELHQIILDCMDLCR